jgi:hypothetical protein
MSFTTMSMFAPRIWGFDPGSPMARVALQAGWRRRDLMWEALMERGCAAWAAGKTRAAVWAFLRARLIASRFATTDLRRAASEAALGVVTRAPGRILRAEAMFARHAEAQIAAMQIAPRARSSLFHLRMEARHRDTYHANMRLRLTRIAGETAACLQEMAQGRAPSHRLHTRWLGEKPVVFDDTRKVLSACLLIPDSLSGGDQGLRRMPI